MGNDLNLLTANKFEKMMLKRKSIMLLITYKCNLHCSYCYEPKILHGRMTVLKAKKILTEQLNLITDGQPIEIQFMGGEPLLEFSLIKEVSEWLWNNGFDYNDNMIFAPTNGTLLTQEMKDWFIKNKNRIFLGLSFDGDISMQNENRSNSFNSIDLSFFANTWPEQSVKMTISPATVNQMADGVKFLHSNGFKYISTDLAMGNNVLWSRENLSSYKRNLDELSEFYLSNSEIIPFSMLRLEVKKLICTSDVKLAKTCGCGENLFCFDWTGKRYACHLFSPVALSVDKANRSNELYDFSKHESFRSEKCNKCILYELCSHCYGMNYICSDDVSRISSFQCKAFKLQFVANCQYQIKLAQKLNDKDTLDSIYRVINKIKI